MKYFDWNHEKDEKLKLGRKIGFEDILTAIETGGLIEIRNHPNPKRYGKQKEFVVLIEGYVYVVPFVEDDEKIFLKTIFPNRKETKKYYEKL